MWRLFCPYLLLISHSLWCLGKTVLITGLYNFDPLKPQFYTVKQGFTGVYIIFLISAQKHRLWVLVRTASPRRFYRVPTIYIYSRNMKSKHQSFLSENFSVFGGEMFCIFVQACFRNGVCGISLVSSLIFQHLFYNICFQYQPICDSCHANVKFYNQL